MFVTAQIDVHGFRQPVAPFELHVFDDARREAVTPARIDGELPAHAGVFEPPFAAQPRFLRQFPPGRLLVCLADEETSGYGLPELERTPAAQQQRLAVVSVNDDENGFGPAEVSRHAACAGGYRLP